jgi:DUF4097 and DUF4098 domain-containing protein YvlB
MTAKSMVGDIEVQNEVWDVKGVVSSVRAAPVNK